MSEHSSVYHSTNGSIPAIDWDLAAQLSGNNLATAKELLGMLIKDLPDDVDAIDHAYQQQDLGKMQNLVHRLHGAVCYCGVPALKASTVKLENELKAGEQQSIDDAYESFNSQVDRLLLQAKNELN